jgi:hypothetical protein
VDLGIGLGGRTGGAGGPCAHRLRDRVFPAEPFPDSVLTATALLRHVGASMRCIEPGRQLPMLPISLPGRNSCEFVWGKFISASMCVSVYAMLVLLTVLPLRKSLMKRQIAPKPCPL